MNQSLYLPQRERKNKRDGRKVPIKAVLADGEGRGSCRSQRQQKHLVFFQILVIHCTYLHTVFAVYPVDTYIHGQNKLEILPSLNLAARISKPPSTILVSLNDAPIVAHSGEQLGGVWVAGRRLVHLESGCRPDALVESYILPRSKNKSHP